STAGLLVPLWQRTISRIYPSKRACQRDDGSFAALRRAVEPRADAIPALGLSAGEGSAGDRDEAVRLGAILRKGGNADAHRPRSRPRPGEAVRLDGRADPLRHLDRASAAGLRQHDDELAGVEARDEVERAHLIDELCGQLLHGLIARAVVVLFGRPIRLDQ